MAGYLAAIVTLSGGTRTWNILLSFIPPFSPFVMLARVLTGNVAPWEVALSIAILIARHRGGRRGGDAALRRRRPAVWPTARVPRLHRRRPPGLTDPIS